MTSRILTALFPFLVITMIGACTPTYEPIRRADDHPEIDQARRFTAQGDHQAAARIYRQLAGKSSPPASDSYRYLAADSLFRAGDIDAALKLADETNPGSLSLNDRYRLDLLYGRIFLAKNQPEKTLFRLEPLPAGKMSPDLQLDYYLQRAEVFSLLGNHLESAREQIFAEKLMSDSEAIAKSQIAIIEELAALSDESLLQLQGGRRDTLSGWMALTRIFKQSPPGTRDFDARIQEWAFNFPGHPANIRLLESRINLVPQREAFTIPKAIGVVLPGSGPLAQAGEAIRQGILIAQKFSSVAPVPTRFYNSDLADPVSLYRQAVDDGADVMIGPLEKEMLKAMATRNELSIPVLALNQLPELSMPNLYQFGLMPEDEVEQAANSAWFDGYHRALVFTPDTSHGQRLATFFSQKWRQLGGEIERSETYDPNKTEYEAAVKQLLDVETSGSSGSAETFGIAASRRVSDFVFLIALPEQARLIKPLLEYYYGGQIAVYGTSQLYSGRENPQADQDLSGTVFCDIPWLFDSAVENAPTLEAVFASWQHPAINFIRLMALGFDAYNLLPHLIDLETDPEQSYPGVTGKLSVTEGRRIRRQLVCAEFQNGIPVPRTFSPHSNRDAEFSLPVRTWDE
ncbi:MAG: penicillin-binding protein activator [Gammaproteobacteria bacterium]